MFELPPQPSKAEIADDKFHTWGEFGNKAFELIGGVKKREREAGNRPKYLEKSSANKHAPRSGVDQKYAFRETESGFSIRVTNEEKPKSRINPKTGKSELTKGKVEMSELLGVNTFDDNYFDYVVKVTRQAVDRPGGHEVRLLFNAVPPGRESQAEQLIDSQEGVVLPAQADGQNFAERLYEILQKSINR